MTAATTSAYRRALHEDLWHFRHACPHWPLSHFLEFETPNRPPSVCSLCERHEWSYDAAEAGALFAAHGRLRGLATGEAVYRQDERTRLLRAGEPIYLLLDGMIDVVVAGQRVECIRPGEIFGELESISATARCASAIARCPSRVAELDADTFRKELTERPGFAVRVLSVLVSRLRRAASARMRRPYREADEYVATSSNSLEPRLLRHIVERGAETSRVCMNANSVIVREGDAAMFMYVVLEGRVDILLAGHLVETIGPGGFFGEMALFDRTTRCGTALAQSDSSLLAISRADFAALLVSQPAFIAALVRALAERRRLITKSNELGAA